MEIPGPVVWCDTVHRRYYFFESVGLHLRTVIWSAVKQMGEIVDGFLAVAFAIDNGDNFEPDQVAFVVIVRAAAPIEPASPESETGLSDGGVEQRAPSPSGATGAERCRNAGEIFVVLLGGPQAAARCKHGAEIIRKTFVNPEQIGLHRHFVIGSGQISGTPEFSIPGVRELVSEQA